MALPKPFNSQSSAVASYDWTELSSGNGYKNFFGGYANPNGYFLSTQALNSAHQETYSKIGKTTVVSLSPTYGTKITANFDSVFDVPQIIDGVCFVNASVGINSNAIGDNETADIGLQVDIQKNGVHLVSGSMIYTDGSLNTTTNKFDSMEVALDLDVPKTDFAIGDTMRFVTRVIGNSTTANTLLVGLAHDGSGRADGLGVAGQTIEAAHSTILKFAVPFVIDV